MTLTLLLWIKTLHLFLASRHLIARHGSPWVIKIMVSDDDKTSVNNVTEASKQELVRSYCVCQKRSRAWTVRGGI